MAILKYELIMNYLKNEILNGTLKKGDKIYSETELMAKFNVSRHTVREAMSRLLNEGCVVTQHGKGSFVAWEEEDPEVLDNTQKTILVMVSYLNNHIQPDIIQRIEKKCAEKGYNMMLKCTHNKVFDEKECLMTALNGEICGIIMEPCKTALPSPNKELCQMIRDKGIPLVFIHGYFDAEKDDYVVVDDVQAGYDACMELIKKGHKSIGGVFKADDIQGHHRYAGMMKALYEYQIKINENNIIWVSTADEKIILASEITKQTMFKRLKSVTASICYNDDMAIAVAETLFNMGVSIPEEHSLIGFDNTQFGGAYRVPISSMDHPYGEIGEIAFEGIYQKLLEPRSRYQKKLYVDYIEKNSILCPL